MGKAAAERFAGVVREAVASRGRALVALSGGSTPQQMFRLLSRPPYQSELPWKDVIVFWGDERLVAPDDPGSNFYHARRLLFEHVGLLQSNIHRVQGESAHKTALARYEKQLREAADDGRHWPRFDLILLGLGHDGHTASLFPGPISNREKEQPLIVVEADYEGRPAQRLSMTPLLINDARQVLFLATGQSKARALAAVLKRTGDPEKWPARRIELHDGRISWFVDAAAAGQ